MITPMEGAPFGVGVIQENRYERFRHVRYLELVPPKPRPARPAFAARHRPAPADPRGHTRQPRRLGPRPLVGVGQWRAGHFSAVGA